MRYVYLVTFFALVLAVGMLGFRGSISTKPPLEVFPDMDRQAKYETQGRSPFFADGRSDRPLPTGVVSRNAPMGSPHLVAGRTASGDFARGFPAEIAVDNVLMARGQDRYTIYCAPCHGANGDGRGIVTNYGWGAPANFHSDVFRAQPEGEIYNTITNGKNTMFPYGDKLEVRDRWAVVAYLRALQRANNGTAADVPAAQRSELGIQ